MSKAVSKACRKASTGSKLSSGTTSATGVKLAMSRAKVIAETPQWLFEQGNGILLDNSTYIDKCQMLLSSILVIGLAYNLAIWNQ